LKSKKEKEEAEQKKHEIENKPKHMAQALNDTDKAKAALEFAEKDF
jgi:hypothetical protein